MRKPNQGPRSHSPVLYQLSYAHQKRGQANTTRRIKQALAFLIRVYAEPIRKATRGPGPSMSVDDGWVS